MLSLSHKISQITKAGKVINFHHFHSKIEESTLYFTTILQIILCFNHLIWYILPNSFQKINRTIRKNYECYNYKLSRS